MGKTSKSTASNKSEKPDKNVNDRQMPLIAHLLELRSRLLWCFGFFAVAFVACLPISDHLFGVLVSPLADLLTSEEAGRRLIYTGLPEAFVTNLKVALFSAFFISVPWISYQLSRFVMPGLYDNERRVFRGLVVAAPVLFLIGALIAYYLVIPKAWAFFLSYESAGSVTGLPIQLEARVSEYLSMTLQLMLAFGICFQLPLILVILSRLGVLQPDALVEKRRYAFIGILIVSAILTPPDVFSMIALATPIYLLYELSIFFVRFTNAKK